MKFTSFAYGGEKYIVILPRFFLERLHMDNLIVYIMFYCDIQVHMHSYVPTLYNLEGNAHWIHSSSHFLSQRIWYCFPQQSGEQGRVPVLLLKHNDTTPKRKPVIVFLHSSYKCKEWLRPLLEVNISLFVALEKKSLLLNSATMLWTITISYTHIYFELDGFPFAGICLQRLHFCCHRFSLSRWKGQQ